MKKQSIALAAALLLSSVAAASAATMLGQAKASDTLNLTSTQQKTAGTTSICPRSIRRHRQDLTSQLGRDCQRRDNGGGPEQGCTGCPSLRPYDFAMVQGKLVIVNPTDKKIAEVITG